MQKQMIISTVVLVGVVAGSFAIGWSGAAIVHHFEKDEQLSSLAQCSSNFFICDDEDFPVFHRHRCEDDIHNV